MLLLLLRNEYDHLSGKIEVILEAIGRSSLLSLSLQEAMSKVKHQALELSQQIKGYVKLLEIILQSDDDIYAYMKLHMLAEDSSVYHMPISEGASVLHSKGSDLETLLDSMLIDYQALQCLIDSLHVKLTTAEQAVSLRLDTSRNELLVASTVMSVVACTIGVASVVTGAFGMNLDNVDFLQPVPGVFVSVCILCILIILGLSGGILYYFHCYNVLPSHGYLGWRKRKVLFD
ncbi:hypothetical protein EON65_00215 [archaeon]|nr:MAG: hypothetical protein EON65_00215 [archaeon]